MINCLPYTVNVQTRHYTIGSICFSSYCYYSILFVHMVLGSMLIIGDICLTELDAMRSYTSISFTTYIFTF